jgi:pyruvate formate lyase activating enzyme
MNDRTPLNKREFLKLCLLGGCSLALEGLPWRSDGVPVSTAAPVTPGAPGELWKWSKEGSYYIPASGGITCTKCPNGCFLAPGALGLCRNRINQGGRMYSIAYGNPCAVHIDPVEKKPLFHFLPSTLTFSIAAAGCNLRCLNCQNWQISQVSPRETENADLMPEKVVEECRRSGCQSIAYTYSEPNTFYEYGFDTAMIARTQGIRNIWKSSGYINEAPLRALCPSIDAANIDLKSFDPKVYKELNGATLEPVLRTLRILREEKVWLEITNLVIPTWTDNMETIRKMTSWLCENGLQECPLHFTRFTPLYKLSQLPPTPVSTLEAAAAIARKAGVKYVYIGNVPGHEMENTVCPRCGQTLIERRGFSVVRNDLSGGTCSKCGERIAGVWS